MKTVIEEQQELHAKWLVKETERNLKIVDNELQIRNRL